MEERAKIRRKARINQRSCRLKVKGNGSKSVDSSSCLNYFVNGNFSDLGFRAALSSPRRSDRYFKSANCPDLPLG